MVSLKINMVLSLPPAWSTPLRGRAKIPSAPTQPDVRSNKAVHSAASVTVKSRFTLSVARWVYIFFYSWAGGATQELHVMAEPININCLFKIGRASSRGRVCQYVYF